MNACSEEGAEVGEEALGGEGDRSRVTRRSPVTRRSLIGGVVGAGLLEMLSAAPSVQNEAMAADLSAGRTGPGSAGPGERPGAEESVLFTADAPRVYTRAQWNARAPRRPAKMTGRRPDHIVVHHTATPNSRDRSRAHAFALSRLIQDIHMDRNRWDDAGQQLTISRGGFVMEGRNRSLKAIRNGDLAIGAQVLHHNEHTIGIENEGTYMTKAVPRRLWSSLVEVCAWLCRSYDLEPSKAIVGHRDYNKTACPGDVLYARLPALRRAVTKRLDGGSGPPDNATGDEGLLSGLPNLDDLT
ncbi:peptidoglycan recognition family protein [Actinomadura sp. 3N508]|uniref:peptidoglycan recognition family protein n=1 Tax=Actinomadura sp. 3N508 TaxID=3375153 RepID=UPI0037B26B35